MSSSMPGSIAMRTILAHQQTPESAAMDKPLDLSINRSSISVIQETKPLFIQTNIESLTPNRIIPHHQPIFGQFNSAAGLLQQALLKPLLITPNQLNSSTFAQNTLLSIPPQESNTPKSTTLPQCSAPANLNSNWIAMKFGAAVGPNRMSYPREFKLMVIEFYYSNGHNKYRTCKEFQITKSMLNGWLAKLEKIKESRPGSLKSGRSGRRPQFPDIEKQLYELYKESLLTGQKIGNRWIRDTARSLAQKQCSQEQLSGMCQFSERWLSNFKKRYRINLNRDWLATNSNGGADSSSSASSTDQTRTIVGEFHANSESDGVMNNVDAKVHNGMVSGSTDSVNTNTCELMERASSDTSSSYPTELSDTDSGPASPNVLMIDDHHQTEPINYKINTQSLYSTPQSVSHSNITNNPLSFSWPSPNHPIKLSEPSQLLPANSQLGHTTPNNNFEPGRRGRKVQFPHVERVLYKRLMERQSVGHRLSNRWMQEQARAIAAQICPEVLAEATKSARCMFSEHWLHNFKKRYNVTLKCQSIADSRLIETEPLTPVLHHQRVVSIEQRMQPQLNTTVIYQAQPQNQQQQVVMIQMQQWLLQQALMNSAFTPIQPPNHVKSTTALTDLYQSLMTQRQ